VPVGLPPRRSCRVVCPRFRGNGQSYALAFRAVQSSRRGGVLPPPSKHNAAIGLIAGNAANADDAATSGHAAMCAMPPCARCRRGEANADKPCARCRRGEANADKDSGNYTICVRVCFAPTSPFAAIIIAIIAAIIAIRRHHRHHRRHHHRHHRRHHRHSPPSSPFAAIIAIAVIHLSPFTFHFSLFTFHLSPFTTTVSHPRQRRSL
jgi:hypothetical protein